MSCTHVTLYWKAIILLCENLQFGAQGLYDDCTAIGIYCMHNLSCPRTDKQKNKQTNRHINKRTDKWLFALHCVHSDDDYDDVQQLIFLHAANCLGAGYGLGWVMGP